MLHQLHAQHRLLHVPTHGDDPVLGEEERDVTPGSLLYVRAATEHSFFEIQEDMLLLVFFSQGSPAHP